MSGVIPRIVLGLVMFASVVNAEPLAPANVPAPLQSWVPWVLDDIKDRSCPYWLAGDTRQCVWPGSLQLDLSAAGGQFEIALELSNATWFALPGRAGQWPQEVAVDGLARPVVQHQGAPALELTAGRHQIKGHFMWPKLPETLQVPASYGIITLKVDGQAVPVTQVPLDGRLWLQAPVSASDPGGRGDELQLVVARQLIDELPLQVVTQLDLDVAGTQREITLTGALLPTQVPMNLESALPARLETDGQLRLQVRPGHWTVRVSARAVKPVIELALPTAIAPWPAEEIWTFAARPALRVIELRGASAIDPHATRLPPEWQQLPAYRLHAGETLTLVERRRGDPEPAPDQLNLARELWLDFDGAGFTSSDTITGQMTRKWRLEAPPTLDLGRVALDGEPQFITTINGERHGIEVRRGAVQLRADSRIAGAPRRLDAVGWAQDFNRLSINLHLPPGWRLWSADGVDNVPDTWLHRWSLFDLFLVMITSLAIARLWDWRWALLALGTLALIWHEPAAPRQIWLHLLATIALLRVLPSGRPQQLARIYRNGALIGLLVLSVNFAIEQVRMGLYPQLETGVARVPPQRLDAASPTPAAMMVPAEAPAADAQVMMERTLAAPKLAARAKSQPMTSTVSATQRDLDPKALIQTGPGIPTWQWRTIALNWNGPVTQGQALGLVLLSPAINLAFALLRVALLVALCGLFLRAAVVRVPRWWRHGAQPAALMFLIIASGQGYDARAELPSPEMLEELKRRLLLPPDCLPNCAEIPRLTVTLENDTLTVHFDLHATRQIAVPLPGGAEQWTPATVLVDGIPSAALNRAADGVLWLLVAPGTHDIVLAGATPPRASFQLSMGLVPQQAQVSAAGWTVDGIKPDGSSEPQLILTRLASTDSKTPEALAPRALPAFFQIERTLQFGLDWRVTTRVVRLTPVGAAAALAVPLLPGESITTDTLKVDDGHVQINVTAEQAEFTWESVLAKGEQITLTAPRSAAWVETWRADISPLWHAEISGIPVSHHQSDAGQWLPEWRPWAGEQVTLRLSRPQGVPGQIVTIDRSVLRLSPGQRAMDAALDFSLRSSQGGQHVLDLPPGAILQTVTLNGVPQPNRQQGQQLTLPTVPGTQLVALTWREPQRLPAHWVAPNWSLGAPSVNAEVHVQMPEDRWTLLTRGPRLGPAMLVWGVLAVVVAVGIALGRTHFTPLNSLQWILLGIGLSQTSVLNGLMVIGWLFALAWRSREPPLASKTAFNLLQVALAGLTCVALAILFEAIRHGLLGLPQMQIAGNDSSAYALNWYQDRVTRAYPQPTIWSVPLWVYRALMLAWALWLAFAVLRWLRWGWGAFNRDGVWRSVQWRSASVPRARVSTDNKELGI